MNRLTFSALMALLALAACSKTPSGRQCFISSDAGAPQQSVVASPALECQSRTCLHLGSQTSDQPDLCTAECSSDDDCAADPSSKCASSFICTIPVTEGPFCCKKMCVCKDYLIIPDGGIQAPATCDSSNPINECCNLSGRRSNSQYPACE